MRHRRRSSPVERVRVYYAYPSVSGCGERTRARLKRRRPPISGALQIRRICDDMRSCSNSTRKKEASGYESRKPLSHHVRWIRSGYGDSAPIPEYGYGDRDTGTVHRSPNTGRYGRYRGGRAGVSVHCPRNPVPGTPEPPSGIGALSPEPALSSAPPSGIGALPRHRSRYANAARCA